MPLTALILESRLIREIAPGNAPRFYELLTQADERLLEVGKWQWTRGPLDLTPVDGIVTLPDGYTSIVGCRIGSMAKGVLWQEIEYLEDGPGVIPVEGLNGQLLDLGLAESGSNSPATITISGLTPSGANGQLIETTFVDEGRRTWSNTGSPITDSYPFRVLAWDPDENSWVFTYIPDATATSDVQWTSDDQSIDPIDATGWIAGAGAGGTLSMAFSPASTTSISRRYRCTGSNPEEIVVLARYSPISITGPSDIPRCQSFAALKQAMMSIIYESANDLERSNGYMQMAVRTLDFQEESYRGSARKVFDPKIYGPPKRRSHSNFP